MEVTSRQINELVLLPASKRMTRSDHVVATVRLAARTSSPQVLGVCSPASVVYVFKGVA